MRQATMIDLWSLPRNDVAAALAMYRKLRAEGPVADAAIRVLARLQDDPTEFFQALKRER